MKDGAAAPWWRITEVLVRSHSPLSFNIEHSTLNIQHLL
jgi:hypothetical protein